MNKVARHAVLFIAQGAYSGRSPAAPGTAGTFVGIAIYLVMHALSPPAYLAVCVIVCGVGVWASNAAEGLLGCKDCSSIVIDEIAGYLLAMFFVPFGWGYVTAGFLVFRFFDIIKPCPLYGLQKLRGGWGVMIDDIGAGIYTNIVLQVASHLLNR